MERNSLTKVCLAMAIPMVLAVLIGVALAAAQH